MTATLGSMGKADERYLLGTFCAGKAGIAIDATPADVETTAAFDYCIGGIWYTNAIDAAIDISAEVASIPAALADGYEQIFVFEIDASGNYTVSAGTAASNVDVDAGDDSPGWPEPSSASVCPFAAVKVRNASGSAFTLGTTSLAAAGITDTYYDLCRIPA